MSWQRFHNYHLFQYYLWLVLDDGLLRSGSVFVCDLLTLLNRVGIVLFRIQRSTFYYIFVLTNQETSPRFLVNNSIS